VDWAPSARAQADSGVHGATKEPYKGAFMFFASSFMAGEHVVGAWNGQNV